MKDSRNNIKFIVPAFYGSGQHIDLFRSLGMIIRSFSVK
jgi:hypothetical protein